MVASLAEPVGSHGSRLRPFSAPPAEVPFDEALSKARAHSEPPPGEDLDDGAGGELVLDLDAVTAVVIEMFQNGRGEEALEVARSFAEAAREALGRTHPIRINALATVAALAEQLGDASEAQALLEEAEDLHEELQMEVLAEYMDSQLDGMPSDEEVEEHASGRDLPPGGDPPKERAEQEAAKATPESAAAAGAAEGEDGGARTERRRKRKARAPKVEAAEGDDGGGAFLTGVDPEEEEDSADDEDVASSDAEHGDAEGGWSDEEEREEAEATAITLLTWEVNQLVSKGEPEKAAKLLCEAERTMLSAAGFEFGDVRGLTRAALHTLWAGVLDSVGESDKARDLYDEALWCLAEDVTNSKDFDGGSGSSTPEDEDEDEEDSSEGEEDDVPTSSAESDLAEPETAAVHSGDADRDPVGPAASGGERPGPAESSEESGPLPAATAAEPPAKRELPPAPWWAPVLADAGGADPLDSTVPQRQPSPPPAAQSAELAGQVGSPTALPEDGPSRSPSPPGDAGEKPLTAGSAGSAASSTLVPSPPKPRPTGSGGAARPRRPPPLAPKAKAAAAAGDAAPVAKAAAPAAAAVPAQGSGSACGPGAVEAPKPKRAGGGFAVVPPPKAKAQAVAAKAKRSAGSRKAADSAADASKDEPTASAAESAAEDEPAVPVPEDEESEQVAQNDVPKTPQEQLQVIKHAMTSADHYLGLLDFGRAADRLEEQLLALSKQDAPHRQSDVHVQLLMKYGGVLWWDGDLEGAVDAFSASDEILAERPQDPIVQRRRADIWAQLAQVHRASGDLEAADAKLSEAVEILAEIKAIDTAVRVGQEAIAKLGEIASALEAAAPSSSSAASGAPGSAAAAAIETLTALVASVGGASSSGAPSAPLAAAGSAPAAVSAALPAAATQETPTSAAAACAPVASASSSSSMPAAVAAQASDAVSDGGGGSRGGATGADGADDELPPPIDDALRDAQAALGQLCVQRKDYARAECLYLAAFGSESDADGDMAEDEDEEGREADDDRGDDAPGAVAGAP